MNQFLLSEYDEDILYKMKKTIPMHGKSLCPKGQRLVFF